MTKDKDLIMLYDGKCNVCNSAVQFTINRFGPGVTFKYASLQSRFAAEKLKQFNADCFEDKSSPEVPTTSAVIFEGKIYTKFQASVVALQNLCFPYNILGNILRFIPKPVGDFIYKHFAANRFLLFGGTAEIQPIPESKEHLFLDKDEGIHACPLPKKKAK